MSGFFAEINDVLDSQKISFSLVNRMQEFGETGADRNRSFRETVDKGDFGKVESVEQGMNRCYEIIADNLHSISHLSDISNALHLNFRHVVPLDELPNSDVAWQKDNFTLTVRDEIYFEGNFLDLRGQKKTIFELLLTHPDGVGWDLIKENVNSSVDLSRENIVDLVSAVLNL